MSIFDHGLNAEFLGLKISQSEFGGKVLPQS